MSLSFITQSNPIDSLPVELLSHIFELCIGTAPQEPADLSSSFTVAKAPNVLAAVSKHWRRVAQETSSLWTTLFASLTNVCDDDPNYKPFFRSTHFAIHLRYSKHRLLDIVIDARDPEFNFEEPELESTAYEPPFSSKHAHAALVMLLPHISRWRSFTMLVDTWKPMYTALRLVNSFNAPMLESLTMMRCNEYISHAPAFAPADLFVPLQFTNSKPNMRHLILRGVPAAWSSLAFPMPLQTLEITSLSASVRPSLKDIYTILSCCASTLRTLRIINDTDFDIGANTTIILPRLQSLTLSLRLGNGHGHGLIQSGLLSAPALREVTLDAESHPGDVGVPDASEVLRCLCLRELKLERVALRSIQSHPLALITEIARARHVELERMDIQCLCNGAPNEVLEKLVLNDCTGVERRTLEGLKSTCRRDLRIEVQTSGEELADLNLEGVSVHRNALDLESDLDELPLGEEEAYMFGGEFDDPEFDAHVLPVLEVR